MQALFRRNVCLAGRESACRETTFEQEPAIKPAHTAALATLLVVCSSSTHAADPARGQARSAQCVACHGQGGVSTNPLFPHLAGQQAAYLQRQLEAFKDGERYHPLMTPVAQSLSLDDIDDLAAHYSRLGPLPRAEAAGQTASTRRE